MSKRVTVGFVRTKELQDRIKELDKLFGYCSKERDEIWAKLKQAEKILRLMEKNIGGYCDCFEEGCDYCLIFKNIQDYFNNE